MLLKSRKKSDISENEVTPEDNYRNRRSILKGMGIAAGGTGLAVAGLELSRHNGGAAVADEQDYAALSYVPSDYSTDEEKTAHQAVVSYNNYYEFGLRKDQPARYAGALETKPWTIEVEGEAEKTGTFDFEDLIKPHQLEERIYRLRCVEAWSMVIPWVGIPVGDVLKQFEPTSGAKFVQFETLADRDIMPGLRSTVLDWPYVEGLRLDEAMNPLALFAVGLYGKELPNQNGAPIRLVVPWKYGFKSIKSIVKIRFMRSQPETAWNKAAPRAYGFYSNVNPDVSTVRWAQDRERRIGELRKRPTLKFNGYEEEVASLYAGMDLRRYF